jgi:hypothetical protein
MHAQALILLRLAQTQKCNLILFSCGKFQSEEKGFAASNCYILWPLQVFETRLPSSVNSFPAK